MSLPVDRDSTDYFAGVIETYQHVMASWEQIHALQAELTAERAEMAHEHNERKAELEDEYAEKFSTAASEAAEGMEALYAKDLAERDVLRSEVAALTAQLRTLGREPEPVETPTGRRCTECGDPIPADRRADATRCGARCDKRAYRHRVRSRTA